MRTLTNDIYVPLSHSFRRLYGEPKDVHVAHPPGFVNTKRHGLKGAKAQGIRYERKVAAELKTQIPDIEIHPCFSFKHFGSVEKIIPDAIHFGESRITIIEIKYRHTYDAWNQITRLYAPVVAKLCPSAQINRLEICRYYDTEVNLPEEVEFVYNLKEFIQSSDGTYGVHIHR